MPTIVMPIIANTPTPMEKISTIKLTTVNTPQAESSSLRLPNKAVSVIWLDSLSVAKVIEEKNKDNTTGRINRIRQFFRIRLFLCFMIKLYHIISLE